MGRILNNESASTKTTNCLTGSRNTNCILPDAVLRLADVDKLTVFSNFRMKLFRNQVPPVTAFDLVDRHGQLIHRIINNESASGKLKSACFQDEHCRFCQTFFNVKCTIQSANFNMHTISTT